MRTFATRVFAASLAAAFVVGLTACSSGGSIGTPSIPPTPATIVVTPTGATAGAYRIGYTGAWTTFSVTGPTASFTIPAGTAGYSIAFNCGDGIQVVLNYAPSDRTVVAANCDAFTGVVPTDAIPDTPINGTYDASALGAAGGAAFSGNGDEGPVTVAGAAGTYSGLNVQPGPQTFGFAAYDASFNILGYKTVRNVSVGGTPLEVDFPALTAADAAQTEPLSATGLGSGGEADVEYLPGGGPQSIDVTSADETSYAGVPAADFGTGDVYLGAFENSASGTNQAWIAAVITSRTSTAPIAVTMPTLAQTAIDPADLSFPLPYTGLSASDVVRGLFEAEYVNASGGGELDIATPAYLAGRSSYAPPSFAGIPAFVTVTAANTAFVELGLLGFTYQPGDTLDYIDLAPPPGQTIEAYLTAYAPSGGGGGQPTLASFRAALRGHALARRSLLDLGLMKKH